jgi:hypothetical protein
VARRSCRSSARATRAREVLIPAAIAGPLLASRGDAPAAGPVFSSLRRPGQPLAERAVNYIVKDAAERAGVNPTVGALAAERTRQSRDRQWCANHPRVGDARAHRPQDDVGICACSAGRKFWSGSQDEVNEGEVPSGITIWRPGECRDVSWSAPTPLPALVTLRKLRPRSGQRRRDAMDPKRTPTSLAQLLASRPPGAAHRAMGVHCRSAPIINGPVYTILSSAMAGSRSYTPR